MDGDPTRRDRRRWSCRERFLGGAGGGEGIRPAIVRSWTRSRQRGVPPDDTPEVPALDFDPEQRLLRLALPVLDRLADQVQDVDMTVILTDARGLVLDRRAGSAGLRRGLDRVYLAPGHLYAEATVGTNGIGTAAEEGQPAWVIGSEHYVEWLRWLSCAGVPIRDPITGRIEGILDLTCRLRDTSPLMLPFVREGVRQIQEQLYRDASDADRALLDRFIGVARRTRRPVVAVNPQTVISNLAAARLLEPADHAHLWSQIGGALVAGIRGPGQVHLSKGMVANVRCAAVDPDRPERGAVLELDLEGRTQGQRSGRCSAIVPPPPGRSPAWRRVVQLAAELARSPLPVAITGEPGSGKLELARYLHDLAGGQGPFTVLDAALARVEGGARWSARVRERLAQPGGSLVLRHLDLLPRAGLRVLDAILEAAGGAPGPRLVATITSPSGEGGRTDLPLGDRFAAVVHVPALRERREDVPEIIPALIRRHARPPGPRCSEDVVRVLSRGEWPGNVRELEGVIKRVLTRRGSGEITLHDLPAEYLQVPSRRLSAIEQAERAAILQAMERAGGNKSQAAAMLGIGRATLYRKLKELGLGQA
jgi:transcriptional regulator of acetoin/glycerol metabolism